MSHVFYTTPSLRLVVGPASSVEADVLAVPVFSDTDTLPPDLPDDVREPLAGLRGTREL